MPKKKKSKKNISVGTFNYLKKKTIDLSEADNWEDAKYEWNYFDVYEYKEKEGHCICGNKIKYGYWLINEINGEFMEVGSAKEGHQKHFPKVVNTIEILKKSKGLMKSWWNFRHHAHETEKICNPLEYSKECFERFCNKYINNIKNMTIKECLDFINELKEIKKYYTILSNVDDKITELKDQIKKILNNINIDSLTKKKCNKYIKLIKNNNIPYPDIDELLEKLNYRLNKIIEWQIEKEEDRKRKEFEALAKKMAEAKAREEAQAREAKDREEAQVREAIARKERVKKARAREAIIRKEAEDRAREEAEEKARKKAIKEAKKNAFNTVTLIDSDGNRYFDFELFGFIRDTEPYNNCPLALDVNNKKFYHIIDDDFIYGGEVESFEIDEFGIPKQETIVITPNTISDEEDKQYIPVISMKTLKLHRMFDPTLEVHKNDSRGKINIKHIKKSLDESPDKKIIFIKAFVVFGNILNNSSVNSLFHEI